MTLYEFIKVANNDYDTYDTLYDGVVTVCSFDSEDEKSEEYYEKFRIGIMKFVNVVKGVSKNSLSCNWSEMIEYNMAIFKEFAKKHWRNQYEDDEDEFIYQWIKEIHYWIAGEVGESTYKEFVENYMTRMV